jgi:hypothetical protein
MTSGAFDTLAVEPVRAGHGRRAGSRGGRSCADSRPRSRPAVWITELGWATGGPPSAFRVSEARQARLVERTLITLGARREGLGLRGVYFKLEGLTAYRDGRDVFGLHTGLIRRMEREARALGL